MIVFYEKREIVAILIIFLKYFKGLLIPGKNVSSVKRFVSKTGDVISTNHAH